MSISAWPFIGLVARFFRVEVGRAGGGPISSLLLGSVASEDDFLVLVAAGFLLVEVLDFAAFFTSFASTSMTVPFSENGALDFTLCSVVAAELE